MAQASKVAVKKTVAKKTTARSNTPAPADAAAPAKTPGGFAQLGKYAKMHETMVNGKLKCSNTFRYKDSMIQVGEFKPKKDNSVKGKIRAFVASQGPILGADLVDRLAREVDFADSHPSMYVRGGRPTRAWIEGYINGGLRQGPEKFLNLKGK